MSRAAPFARAAAGLATAALLWASVAWRVGAQAPSVIPLGAPRAAATFVDSIGVNLHLAYHDTGYGNVAAVDRLLFGLGVRHVRDGVVPDQPGLCAEARQLAAGGIRFTYLTAPTISPPELVRWAECAGPAIEAYEGPNEYDISHPGNDANWAATLRAYTQTLFRTARSAPTLRRLTVIGPSYTSAAAAEQIGDLAPFLDDGNMHNYFAGHQPATGGWGLGGYGSIAWNLRLARAVSDGRPVMTTETGYSSGGDPHAVDPVTQGIYVPELFLEQFRAGVVRTFYYELVDQGGPPFSHYGLVDANLAPKPAYRSLAAMIHLLGGGSGRHAGRTPSVTLAGNAEAVHALLFRREDGSLVVAVWPTAARFDPDRQTTLAIAPQALLLRVGAAPGRATAYAYADDGALHAAPLTPARTLRLSVHDRLEFVVLTFDHDRSKGKTP